MKLRKLCCRALAIVATVVALNLIQGGAKATKASQLGTVPCENSVELPFKLHDGYLIVVEGRIAAHQHLKFILDTGATHSVLRSKLAKGLGVATRSARLVNLDHVMNQELWEIPDFQLGPLHVPRLPMMLNRLDYLHSAGVQVDAVIGLDVLRLRSFNVDFAQRKIVFGAALVLGSTATLESAETYLALEAQMLNRPVRLVLDTGVPTILLYRDRMGDRLPNLRVERVIRGASAGGAAPLEVVTLPPMRLNGKELDRRAVLLTNSPEGVLPRVDGYLSLAALGARRVSLDFEKNVMSWE
jgi:hypothetical protein